jgi:hypothetical protein
VCGEPASLMLDKRAMLWGPPISTGNGLLR